MPDIPFNFILLHAAETVYTQNVSMIQTLLRTYDRKRE